MTLCDVMHFSLIFTTLIIRIVFLIPALERASHILPSLVCLCYSSNRYYLSAMLKILTQHFSFLPADGANVAYFGWGKINVYQLSLMVTALEKQGEHPLVIMPQKYTRKKFYLRQGVTQFLSEEERALYDR